MPLYMLRLVLVKNDMYQFLDRMVCCIHHVLQYLLGKSIKFWADEYFSKKGLKYKYINRYSHAYALIKICERIYSYIGL